MKHTGHASLTAPCWDLDDFTTYVAAKDFLKYARSHFQTHLQSLRDHGKLDETLTLGDGVPDGLSMQGRVVACSCAGGRMYSISMRGHKASKAGNSSEYWPDTISPDTLWKWKHNKSQQQGLLKTQELCERLTQVLFDDGDHDPQGLILVLGGTGSGKSTLARELIHNRLQKCRERAKLQQTRRPHLVTIEDPIEVALGVGDLREIAATYGIDYTPRQVGHGYDTPTIATALLDAKRQKPAVVFVGEIRLRSDWQALMEFAGSGHLVVATGHSGSLVEGMTNLLNVTQAITTPERAYILSRLLGLVHLRTYSDGGKTYCVPAVWRRTPAGLATFVMDGLTSFLPHCPTANLEKNESCLGRQWFARTIGAIPVLNQCIADDLQGI